MSDELKYNIGGLGDLKEKMTAAYHAVQKGLQAGPVEVVLRRPGRTQGMNSKLHAMISDIHIQAFRGYSFEGVKAVLVNQFAMEMQEAGTPLANPGEKVWDWKAQQAVYVRPSTTKFRKAEASAFIEFLGAVGAEYSIRFSERALEEHKEVKKS